MVFVLRRVHVTVTMPYSCPVEFTKVKGENYTDVENVLKKLSTKHCNCILITLIYNNSLIEEIFLIEANYSILWTMTFSRIIWW